MHYRVREMQLPETKSMIRYFLDADAGFLREMGVDPQKLPAESKWFEMLQEDFARPAEQRQFFYVVWEADGRAVGHSNINKITFGESAYMHLHVWSARDRRRGAAAQLVRLSVVEYFERFQLQQLYCEPYALNPGPNKTLPKAGFRLLETYETTPGWINLHQVVNRWVLDRDAAAQHVDRG